MRLLICLLFLLFEAGPTRAASPPGAAVQIDVVAGASAEPALRSGLNRLLIEYPGVAFSIRHPNGAHWSGGGGLADMATGAAFHANTPISLYSLAKPMTAALAMRLAEQGRLPLDRPLGEVAQVPDRFRNLTVRQLLSHTSGIRHYKDGEWLRLAQAGCRLTAQALAPFRDDDLGTRGEAVYSSFGYVLLSHLIQVVEGRDFASIMGDGILSPAAMTTATLARPGRRRPPNGHVRARLAFPAAPEIDNSCKFGAGALIGSADDVTRFGVAVATGKLVRPASWREMTKAGAGGFALGFGIGKLSDGSIVAVHSGSAIGGTSALVIDVETGISAAIVANAEGPSLLDDARQLLALAKAMPDFAKGRGAEAESQPTQSSPKSR